MEITRRRTEIELIGEFEKVLHEGKHTSVYLFNDVLTGTIQVGIQNHIQVDMETPCNILCSVYGSRYFKEDGTIIYGHRLNLEQYEKGEIK